jgi:protein-S-isoprenylcysteine O-methyltransferase Ste14
MSILVAKIIWVIGVVGWYVIRFPHERKSKRTPVKKAARTPKEWILLTISTTGLGILPAIFVFFNEWPKAFNYTYNPVLSIIGALIFILALWMFYRTHKDLGKNWSVSLDIRQNHKLITHGVYAKLRHPMYTAFWLWALAQAFLLPNFIAGFSGLIGFGILFFARVGSEEALMHQEFDDEYASYVKKTHRIIPFIY